MKVRCPKCSQVLEWSEGLCCPSCAILLKAPSATARAQVQAAPPPTSSKKTLWIGVGAGAGGAVLVGAAILLLGGGSKELPPASPAAEVRKEGPRPAPKTAAKPAAVPATAPEPAPPPLAPPAAEPAAPRKIGTFERRSFLDPDRTAAVGITFDGCRPRVWHADRTSILYEPDGTPVERLPDPPVIVARFKVKGVEYVARRAYLEGTWPSVIESAWSAGNDDRERWIASLVKAGTRPIPRAVYAVEASRQGEELQSGPAAGYSTWVDVAGKTVVLTEQLSRVRSGTTGRTSTDETAEFHWVFEDGRLAASGTGRVVPIEVEGFYFYARLAGREWSVSKGAGGPIAWKDSTITEVAGIPGRSWIAARAGRTLRVLEAATGKTVKEIPVTLTGEWSLRVSPDGSSIAAFHARGFKIYDTARLEIAAFQDSDEPLPAGGAFCSKGDHFALAGPRALAFWSRESGRGSAVRTGNLWVRSVGSIVAARAALPSGLPDRFFLFAPGVPALAGVPRELQLPILQDWRLGSDGRTITLAGERRGDFIGGSAGWVAERTARGTGTQGDEVTLHTLPAMTVKAKIRIERDAHAVHPRAGRSAWIVFEKYSATGRPWFLYGADGSGPRQMGLPAMGERFGGTSPHWIGRDRAFFHAMVSVPSEVQGRTVKAVKWAGFLVDITGLQGQVVRQMENAWAMSPDGTSLLVYDPKLGQVRMHRVSDGAELPGVSIITGRAIDRTPMDASPDGRHLALATGNQLLVIDFQRKEALPAVPTMDAASVLFLDDRRILLLADQQAELFELGPAR